MKIKSGDLIKILAIILFVGLVIFISISPLNKEFQFIEVILGVTTFLFGIFVAFSISDRQNRSDKIKNNISTELSNLFFIFKTSKIFGKSFQKKIQKAIDSYLMEQLDYRRKDLYKTEKALDGIGDLMISAKTKNEKEANYYAYFMEVFNSISGAKKHTINLIGDRVSRFEWIIILFLSSLIIASLVMINTGTIISIVAVSLLIGSVILLVLLLYGLDNLSWKGTARVFEPFQKAFESMGLLRYYPEEVIIRKKVKPLKNIPYRIGRFPHPYPDMRGKKIEVINPRR